MSAATVVVGEPELVLPGKWAEIAERAPLLAETMTAYLDLLCQRLAPASVAMAEVNLRQFAAHLVATDRSCRSARDVTASHVAGWCAVVAEQALTARTINYKLNVLRRFFEHVCGSAHGDAPAEIPVAHRPRPSRSRPPARKQHRKAKPIKRTTIAEPKRPSRAFPPETTWEEIAVRAPEMVATMAAYLEQTMISHRSTSVQAYSLALRHLAAHVTATDPRCVCVADISRAHVEDYKLALARRQGRKGNLSTTTIRHNLGMVRTFFERIVDWDWADAPRRVPIFAGDIPKADEPLPKFLDDPTAAKFMTTLAADPDRRRRLLVELLARTGMRAGELGGASASSR